MTRDDAIKIITSCKKIKPDDDINKFCSFAKISESEFFEIAEKFKNLDIWKKNSEGKWYIPDYLIKNWEW